MSREPQASTDSTGGARSESGAPAAPPAGESARDLPGRHALPREFIHRHREERVYAAAIELVAERGYEPVTVAEIVRRAKIARSTFYAHFSGKEDCFLAAFDWVLERAMGELAQAYREGGETWGERVAAAVAALLRWVAERPAEARVFFVESLTAGAAAVERYEGAARAFAAALRPGREQALASAPLPDTLEETLVGGATWIVYQRIVRGEAEGVGELYSQLVELLLLPYLGAEDAKRVAGTAPAESTDPAGAAPQGKLAPANGG